MGTPFGQILNNSVGGLIGLPKIVSVKAIQEHLQSRLPQFSRENRTSGIYNEDGLTQALVKLLNNKHKFPFTFDKEYMENERKGNSPRSDIAVTTNQPIKFFAQLYADRKTIITFEAKRLANLGKVREKEYLVGRYIDDKFIDSGGIERFKNGTHGIGLGHVGMVGYVQKHDYSYWQKKLNQWIEELIQLSPTKGDVNDPEEGVSWDERDKLIPELNHASSNEYRAYKSNGNTINGSVCIYHFWVNLIVGS